MCTELPENERSKLPAYVCKDDIARRNKLNMGKHTMEVHQLAHKIHAMAATTYYRSRIYINARERFMAVKIENVQRLDKIEQRREIAAFTAYCEAAGLRIKKMRSHLIIEVKG